MSSSKPVAQQTRTPVLMHLPELVKTGLDIIVPFTSPELTRRALAEADRLVQNLDARIRLIALHTVSMRLDLNQPAVSVAHLKRTLANLISNSSIKGEVHLVRDPDQTWTTLLPPRSLTVIVSQKRLWRTREERLAKLLERRGHEVLLVYIKSGFPRVSLNKLQAAFRPASR